MNILDISQSYQPSKFIIVTEATDSPSLAAYIKQLVAPPPDKTIIRWFKSLATAVQAIHSSPLKISHGQISLHNVYFRTSPSNIKLSLPISNLSLRYVTNQSINYSSIQVNYEMSSRRGFQNQHWRSFEGSVVQWVILLNYYYYNFFFLRIVFSL